MFGILGDGEPPDDDTSLLVYTCYLFYVWDPR
jgi:hypothetical protein